MSADGYNGWTNYATWRVNLEICDDITSSLVGEQTFDSVGALAGYLKDEVDSYIETYCCNPEYQRITDHASIVAGWARAFVEDVNWDEIAQGNADELIRSDDSEADD